MPSHTYVFLLLVLGVLSYLPIFLANISLYYNYFSNLSLVFKLLPQRHGLINNNSNYYTNNSISHLLGSFYVPGTVLSFTCVLLKPALWGKYCWCLYFTDRKLRHKEVKAKRKQRKRTSRWHILRFIARHWLLSNCGACLVGRSKICRAERNFQAQADMAIYRQNYCFFREASALLWRPFCGIGSTQFIWVILKSTDYELESHLQNTLQKHLDEC